MNDILPAHPSLLSMIIVKEGGYGCASADGVGDEEGELGLALPEGQLDPLAEVLAVVAHSWVHLDVALARELDS